MSVVERRSWWRTRAVLGTVLLWAFVLACVRLGFWQLDRLEQRRALNTRIARRLAALPLAGRALLEDTSAAHYRRVHVAGQYDDARSIVLPGRSYRGFAGVHLLTPLRLDGDAAVLVNRGWVASADAATIPLDSLPAVPPGQAPDATVSGLVLPLPLAPRGARPAADSAFRRVWYRLDLHALQRQFPYRILPVELQLLPAPDAPTRPTRLPPPALSDGPHLSYAIQWFGFAIIGLLGWLAVFRRGRRPRAAPEAGALRRLLLGLALGLALAPAAARAQLRPLDPADWRIFDRETDLIVAAGGGVLWNQPLPLAGTRATLQELGSYQILWRSGRFGMDLSGVAIWRAHEHTVTRPPDPAVHPASGGVRSDAGPFIAATVLRLSPERWPTDVMIRFGARIPTTSDESGLERDRTDWFALGGARWRRGPWQLAGEAGVGINGARPANYPQSDALLYSASVLRQRGALALYTAVTGQLDGLHGSVRGNEDKAELRTGLRLGRRWWVQTTWVRGLSHTSPDHGILLLAGAAIGCRTDCLPFN